eukprot:gnl/TRDRNA2_/TRDRNA2_129781_c0_seq1.p1 gnl/TRDRNA2_/TRDRNA2_129781_c0~~gnl/TRDRNA2_/TRDRNA2_129781_c0_seq1.p1  ORF type:complete len:385 (+),score=63.58 gnl/TRDRNA2_/TRDRNA2_129781_c0_seq1:23-1156(+)
MAAASEVWELLWSHLNSHCEKKTFLRRASGATAACRLVPRRRREGWHRLLLLLAPLLVLCRTDDGVVATVAGPFLHAADQSASRPRALEEKDVEEEEAEEDIKESQEAASASADTAKYTMDIAQHSVIILVIVTGFILLCLFRGLWVPLVYETTCGLCHCPSPRNIKCCGFTCIGWFLSKICPCCFQEWHNNFRLRIVFLEATCLQSTEELSDGAKVYLMVTCGNNPYKTTSMKRIPADNSRYPLVWNESVDLDVFTADHAVVVKLMDPDPGKGFGTSTDHVEIARCTIKIAEFYHMLDFDADPDAPMGRPLKANNKQKSSERGGVITKKLKQGDEQAGFLDMEMYIKREGQHFGEWSTMSDMSTKMQSAPLMSTMS